MNIWQFFKQLILIPRRVQNGSQLLKDSNENTDDIDLTALDTASQRKCVIGQLNRDGGYAKSPHWSHRRSANAARGFTEPKEIPAALVQIYHFFLTMEWRRVLLTQRLIDRAAIAWTAKAA